MSKLNTAQREKIDEKEFAGPHRSFPIMDQNDVNDAAKLVGHADDPAAVKSRIKSIAQRKGLKLPESWGNANHNLAMDLDQQDLVDIAFFNNDPPPGYVRREGKIFECGEYPEKKFSLTPLEADQAIATFRPVPGDVEHMPTLLSGHLGIMRTIWRDGNAIFGSADVPDWLDKVLAGTGSTISCAWDRAEKTLQGWGWVLDPAVKGAALMSAYAEFTNGLSVNSPYAPATLPTRPVRPKNKETRNMSNIADRLKARWAAFSASEQPAPVPAPDPVPEPAPAPTPEPAPAKAPNAAAFAAAGLEDDEETATADFAASRIISAATESVDALIGAGHIHSSGRSAWIACFTTAGYSDEAEGPSIVTFSKHDGSVINDRVGMLREALRHVPQHTLFSRTLPVQVLNGNKAASETKSAEALADEQAARFNSQLGLPADDTVRMNGNGNGHRA